MKKVMKVNAGTKTTTMSKSPQTTKMHLLRKLAAASEAARERVSGYTDEKRLELEQRARGMIKGVHTQQVCRP
jgi:hypothetical protein